MSTRCDRMIVMTGQLKTGGPARKWLEGLMGNSMHQAGESLTLLLGRPVHLTVSGMESVPTARLPHLIGREESGLLVGVRLQIAGEGEGQIILLFPMGTLVPMLEILLPGPVDPHSLSAEQRSAVQEVGNILASSFLSALSDLIGKRLLPSPPEIHLNDLGGLMQRVMREVRRVGSEVLVVRAIFEEPEQKMELRMFVLSEVAAVELMLREVRSGRGEDA